MSLPITALQSGKYVIAVSGGVDSLVLFHRLLKEPAVTMVVAHYDHGIRPDSAEDRQWVGALAKQQNLVFVYEEGKLGPGASEAMARQARYKFLRRVLKEQGGQAIITAHHQDDMLETAIINLIRGTGRKGLASLADTADIRRPLLAVPKADILAYAKKHGLVWHEDSTNLDDNYLRNHIRHNIVPRFSAQQRQELLTHITDMAARNKLLDELLVTPADNQLQRLDFIKLPHAVAKEVMASWLRANGLRGFTTDTLERAVWASKTFHTGQQTAMLAGVHLVVGRINLALAKPER
jgi:tRNA(Ile)-lysidine synthase